MDRLRMALLLIAFAALCLAAAGQVPQSGTAAAPRVTPDADHPQVAPSPVTGAAVPANAALIRIGSGDLLEISVYGTDFNQVVRVSTSGSVVLPLIGELRIAGLTAQQAQAAIRARLIAGQFFTDPEVFVFTREYATQGVSVLGEVQKPGVYPLLGPRTLLDAISTAGGTTAKAGKLVSITHRDNPGQPVTVELSSAPGKPTPNVDVLPGDTIEVLKAPIVYVVGDVRLPGGFVVENGKQLTVLQAVALAQGPNPTAALESARIIRNSAQGRQDIPIPLKKILEAKAPDTPLQADDIVFVPNSAGKSAFRRGVEAALQAATGVAIYRR